MKPRTVNRLQAGQQAGQQIRRQAGFTLIELMIVAAVLAILTAIAIPNYSSYVRRAHRADAKIALTEVANLQEKHFSDNNTYTDDLADLQYPATSPEGYYTIAIRNVPADGMQFEAFAVPVAGGSQLQDTECLELSINQFGSKDATNDQCWKK